MIVIVEGINRVGKTTLCEKLVNELGFKLFKDDYIRPTFMTMTSCTEKINTTVKMLKLIHSDNNIVIDRLHLTEAVYGSLDRHYEFAAFSDLDTELSKLNSLLVMMIPVDIKMSGEMHGKCEYSANHAFFENFQLSRIKKVMGTYENIDKITELVKEYLDESKR